MFGAIAGDVIGSIYERYGRRYPRAGYGKAFIRWIFEEEVFP